MPFTINPLSFKPNALEPYIDEKTMLLHHDKHHQTYADKLNAAVEKYPKLFDQTVEQLLSNLDQIPSDIRMAVQNHGGGVFNHNLFWDILAPKQIPSNQLIKTLTASFGNFEGFKQQFSQVANSHFGSGWVWLVKNKTGDLKIYSLPNQDSPLSQGDIPILTLDLWEHAYYLKYQNRRVDYIEAWWNVVNWEKVEGLLK